MKHISILALVLASVTAQAAPTKGTAPRSTTRSALSSRPSVDDARLLVGAHFGPTFNSVSWSASQFTPPETNSRTRMMFGFFTEVNFLDYFAFQPELNYMQRGVEVVDRPERGSTIGFGLNYLEIPLFLKAKYNVGYGVRPFFMTGPSIGFLIGKGATISQRDGREREVPDADIRNNYSTLNFAWNVGAGTDIDFAKSWAFMLDARYAFGLTNVLSTTGQRPDPAGEVDKNNSIKLSGFQIMVGIKTTML